jgi:isopentenyl-diphosphate Delta-isomerase
MPEIKYPPVVIVDESDNEIGTAMLADAWQQGLYHRIVAIFIIDDQRRMLLQLRCPNVKVYPNRWDQAAGGHVDEGQTYEIAAANELAEELGLHSMSLIEMGTHKSHAQDGNRIINQFERVYKAEVASDTNLNPEESEITELKWFTSSKLKALIAQKPDSLTPGLLYDIEHYFPEFWS